MQIDGVVSGMDTTAMIEAVQQAQNARLHRLEGRRDQAEDLRDKIGGLRGRLQTLANAINQLQTTGFQQAQAITSDDDAQLAASITDHGKVEPGTHNIQVQQLAQNETHASQGFEFRNELETLHEGTYQVEYDGLTYDVVIGEDDTSLDGFVEQFNETVDGVTARVIDTGIEGQRFRIALEGDVSGAGATIAIDESGADADSPGDVPGFTVTQAAQNARIEYAGITVESSDNTFDDLIDGVRLDVRSEGLGPMTLTIERDDEAITEGMQKVVEAYNDVIGYYRQNRVFDPDRDIRGAFVGESTVNRIIRDIGQVLNSHSAVGGDLRGLSELGILTERDGRLSFDEGQFSQQLHENREDVEQLLTHDNSALTRLRDRLNDVYVGNDGTLVNRRNTIESQIEDMDRRMERLEARLNRQAEDLRQRFTAMEVSLGRMEETQQKLGMFLLSQFGV